MSRKKSISQQVKELKPLIKRLFEGKSANERINTNEIASELNLSLNAFKLSIFLKTLYELTNENVLRHDGYYLSDSNSESNGGETPSSVNR